MYTLDSNNELRWHKHYINFNPSKINKWTKWAEKLSTMNVWLYIYYLTLPTDAKAATKNICWNRRMCLGKYKHRWIIINPFRLEHFWIQKVNFQLSIYTEIVFSVPGKHQFLTISIQAGAFLKHTSVSFHVKGENMSPAYLCVVVALKTHCQLVTYQGSYSGFHHLMLFLLKSSCFQNIVL